MLIRLYTEPQDFAPFRGMLGRYFREDLDMPLRDSSLDELTEEILRERSRQYWVWLAYLDENTPAGFLIAQVDHPGSSWCLCPGDGFIRELAVEPDRRKQGCARALVRAAEAKLRAEGVGRIYLTSDDAVPFWLHLGYRATGQLCRRNRLPVLEKEVSYSRSISMSL